ncbi:MAG: hypothetical protein E2O38_04870 [Proteobacteria bacterium]|nr:MAG: hypothetical protein E2O38_04870 [Pseudomonadota bacterium]
MNIAKVIDPIRVIFAVFAIAVTIVALTAQTVFAQQQSGCFAGSDHLGSPAKVFVSVERYGDWFQISGQIYSSGANSIYNFTADGHSGAGRLYQRHEYESGALYVQVQNLTETDFVLGVESHGVFHFRRASCYRQELRM